MRIYSSFISALLLLTSLTITSVQAEVVTAEEFWQHYNTGNPILIDVRSNDEFMAGHLPQSINIPFDKIESITSFSDDKSQIILLYCRSGRRAEIAEQTLKELGYNHIYNGENYQKLLVAMPESISNGKK
ncbi:rhodanese-like domain-containing protein [Photobacterium frigidiphilum]|uniref:Rhodanese-like domain-containing protein n=1 Tax=Photobacterium frigidiphilum TaxID=264736 RepID=A0A2T3JG67_9GAMM|nr:rhodanese-like domain-containing protein [Photobacterium frigidiphilum]PSU47925.1 rhodanese-like domain-containing protein [Photobacterium frigidiphilum]